MKAPSAVKDPPSGPGRIYSELPVSYALTNKDPSVEVTLLPDGDTVLAAKGSQKAPECFHKIERMLKLQRVLSAKDCPPCGTYMDATGLMGSKIMDGVRRSTMDELAGATVEADKALVF
jgi:uncharacterized protein involved in oxidation of intracellular sulfur